MHAIFVAHGPFAESIKQKELRRRDAIAADLHTLVIPGFDNVELYDLLASLLRIPVEGRAQTNGTSGFWDEWLDFDQS